MWRPPERKPLDIGFDLSPEGQLWATETFNALNGREYSYFNSGQVLKRINRQVRSMEKNTGEVVSCKLVIAATTRTEGWVQDLNGVELYNGIVLTAIEKGLRPAALLGFVNRYVDLLRIIKAKVAEFNEDLQLKEWGVDPVSLRLVTHPKARVASSMVDRKTSFIYSVVSGSQANKEAGPELVEVANRIDSHYIDEVDPLDSELLDLYKVMRESISEVGHCLGLDPEAPTKKKIAFLKQSKGIGRSFALEVIEAQSPVPPPLAWRTANGLVLS